MNRITLQDVLDSTGAILLHGDADVPLTGISTDTRSLTEGDLFLALTGPSFDGNRFAQSALDAGAAALLLREGTLPKLESGASIAVHPDPRKALAELASWYRSSLGTPLVGITGSCGKTSTKDFVRQLLEPHYPVVASPSSFNNEIGVPLTLMLGDHSTRLYAVEMGTNHPGEIAALCRIARPTAGVITNVGTAHLEGLGSLEGIAQEKGDLAAALPRDGFLVLNADCRFTPTLAKRTAARVITFSIEARSGEEGDLDARELYFHSGGVTFLLNGHQVTSPLLGTHNVQNLLAALAVCQGLGFELTQVLPAVSNLEGGRQRMERVQVGGMLVLDDSYNANPDALRAAVRVLAGMHGHRRRVLVLGDMLELGDSAAELHHELGRDAAREGIDRIILVGDLTRAAAAGALEGGLTPDAVIHLETTRAAVDAIGSLVGDGDVVLVKGSRALRLERIVDRLRQDAVEI